MRGHKGRLLKHHCWVWSCAPCYQECCFGAFCMLPACSCWNEERSRVLTIQPFCTISSHLSLQSPEAKCQGCSVFTYVTPCQVYLCREVHYFCESCTNRPSCPVHRMSKRRLKYT